MFDRRIDDTKNEGAYALAILYTVGYLGVVGALMFFEIPAGNKDILLSLFGIMSAAQLGIIKFFFDGSRGAQQAQQANIQRSIRSDTIVQDMAKNAPATAAAAVAAATGVEPVKTVLDTVGIPTDGTTNGKDH